jgi:hypothetical protein
MIAPKYEISDFFRWCPSRDAKLFSWVCKETNKCHPFCNADKCFRRLPRPTQSIMYVPSQVNRSQKCILLIVQYKYIQSRSGDFYSPESDPPHKIMRYWIYYSTQLCFRFPPDRICQMEMICTGGVPVLKRHFGRAGP